MEVGVMELMVMNLATGILDTVYFPTLDGYPLRGEDGFVMIYSTKEDAENAAYAEMDSRGLG